MVRVKRYIETDVLTEAKNRLHHIFDLFDTGQGLRVSTPLHAESAKRFDLIRSTVPDFYARVIKVFPEMLAHERYFRDIDRAALQETYGQTYEGVRAWIEENITDQLELAIDRYEAVMQRARRDPELYPPRYLLTTFMAGGFKREIMPQARPKERAS